jgi:hypothetical protein
MLKCCELTAAGRGVLPEMESPSLPITNPLFHLMVEKGSLMIVPSASLSVLYAAEILTHL